MVIVEGIGGIMTPISKNYFVSDLIYDLDLESIIVTGTKIGSVNHSMLTYEHARQKNLKFKGFIINQNVADGYDLANMKHQIFGLTGTKFLVQFHMLNHLVLNHTLQLSQFC